MLVNLVKIGDSKGVRLPKAVIDQVGLDNDIDMAVKDGKIILSPARQPRAGWEAAAQACHEEGQDDMSDWDNTLNDFEGNGS